MESRRQQLSINAFTAAAVSTAPSQQEDPEFVQVQTGVCHLVTALKGSTPSNHPSATHANVVWEKQRKAHRDSFVYLEECS